MQFVLLDQSTATGQAAQFGGPISPAQLAQIAAAIELQLNRDVARFWGGAGAGVRAGTSPTDVQAAEISAALVDALPDAPGAIAYHDVTGAGVPYILLARTLCSNIMTDGSSVSAVMSHECGEAFVDINCNAWRDDGKGSEWAQEIADAVESNWYAINGVAVSDFLLPGFFAPGAAGPYNFMASPEFQGLVAAGLATVGAVAGTPSGPFATAPGGYQLKRASGGGETQVNGMIAPHRIEKKRHWSSRTFRRGARV